MKRFDILEHDACVLFGENISKITGLLIDKKVSKEDYDLLLKGQDKYAYDVFYLISEVDEKLKDLDYCLMFLNSFPNIKSWRKRITRKDYFLYHFEYYLSSTVGIFDRLLLIVSYVYDLGLSYKHIKLDILLENNKLNRDLTKSLKEFDSYLQKSDIKKQRNMATHRKKISFTELYEISLREYFSKKSDFTEENKKILNKEADIFYSNFRKIKKEEIKKQVSEIDKRVENILNLLYPVIKEKYESLLEPKST